MTDIKQVKGIWAAWGPITVIFAILGNIAFFAWHARAIVSVVEANQVAISKISTDFSSHKDIVGHPIMEERARNYKKTQDGIGDDISTLRDEVHVVSTDVKVLKQIFENIRDNKD